MQRRTTYVTHSTSHQGDRHSKIDEVQTCLCSVWHSIEICRFPQYGLFRHICKLLLVYCWVAQCLYFFHWFPEGRKIRSQTWPKVQFQPYGCNDYFSHLHMQIWQTSQGIQLLPYQIVSLFYLRSCFLLSTAKWFQNLTTRFFNNRGKIPKFEPTPKICYVVWGWSLRLHTVGYNYIPLKISHSTTSHRENYVAVWILAKIWPNFGGYSDPVTGGTVDTPPEYSPWSVRASEIGTV